MAGNRAQERCRTDWEWTKKQKTKKRILSTSPCGYCTFNGAIFILLHYHFTHNYDCFSCTAATTTSGNSVRTSICTNLFFANILNELRIKMQNFNGRFKTNEKKTTTLKLTRTKKQKRRDKRIESPFPKRTKLTLSWHA